MKNFTPLGSSDFKKIGEENRYTVRSNREAGLGRYDICLIPLTTHGKGIVFEIKAPKTKKNHRKRPKSAILQIKQKSKPPNSPLSACRKYC